MLGGGVSWFDGDDRVSLGFTTQSKYLGLNKASTYIPLFSTHTPTNYFKDKRTNIQQVRGVTRVCFTDFSL